MREFVQSCNSPTPLSPVTLHGRPFVEGGRNLLCSDGGGVLLDVKPKAGRGFCDLLGGHCVILLLPDLEYVSDYESSTGPE